MTGNRASIYTSLHRGGIHIPSLGTEAGCQGIEIGDEGLIIAEQEQNENDRQAEKPTPEAKLLHPGVPLHANGNIDKYNETYRQHADELTHRGRREPKSGIFKAGYCQERCIYFIGKHLT